MTSTETPSGRWEVRIKPPANFEGRTVITFAEAYEQGRTRYEVKSPRGTVIGASHNHGAAMSVAHAMASIDELLARVNRLERTVFGAHPGLRASMANRRNRLVAIQDPRA